MEAPALKPGISHFEPGDARNQLLHAACQETVQVERLAIAHLSSPIFPDSLHPLGAWYKGHI
jgi:hypothetical protein